MTLNNSILNMISSFVFLCIQLPFSTIFIYYCCVFCRSFQFLHVSIALFLLSFLSLSLARRVGRKIWKKRQRRSRRRRRGNEQNYFYLEGVQKKIMFLYDENIRAHVTMHKCCFCLSHFSF